MELKKKSEVIKEISGKEVWGDHENTRIEEQCMSPHIVEIIDEISEITGYDLEVTDTELFVGDFRADIVCKDTSTGDVIVIENQLGKTDNEHIGKSFTYLANLNAKAIVWICETARPEHVKAVEWFNENTPEDVNFFLLELKFGQLSDKTSFYYFNNVFIPSLINKIANSVKATVSTDTLESIDFCRRLFEDIKDKVPTVRINNTKRYHKIYSAKGFTAQINFPQRKQNDVSVFTTLEEKNEQLVFDTLEKLKNELNKLGYHFEQSVGQRNKNYVGVKYVFEKNMDVEKIKQLCIDIYNTMKQTIK